MYKIDQIPYITMYISIFMMLVMLVITYISASWQIYWYI